MSKNKFLKGALILTVAGFMVKILGSVNRILLSRMLTGEGIGLYQMAYPVYLLLLSVSSAGVPVAVSILVAEKVARKEYREAHRIFKVTLALMLVAGLLFAGCLYLLAGYLIDQGFIRDSRAYLALVVLTPAVFFSSILASFRGYFQGYQMMTPPAVSQILEQLVRVTAMVLLAWWLLPYGLEYAAAGAAFGAVPGGLTGLVVLTWFYRRARKKWRATEQVEALHPETPWRIAMRLVLLAIPVSCANIMIPVTSSIDMLLVPNALGTAGFGVEQSTTLFGYLAGMAQPLVMLATIPTMSLAASLVPAVSEAYTLKTRDEIERKVSQALTICLLFVLPAVVGMWALAEPISRVLYGTGAAAPVIAHLAPSILFLGIFQVTTGALQGMGKTAVPMWNMLFGAVVKVGAVWYLTAVPAWHILGSAWASNLNFALVAVVNILFLARQVLSFPWGRAIRLAGASVLMAAALAAVGRLTASWSMFGTLLAGLAAAGPAYGAGLWLFRGVTREELLNLPKVGKLLRRFVK